MAFAWNGDKPKGEFDGWAADMVVASGPKTLKFRRPITEQTLTRSGATGIQLAIELGKFAGFKDNQPKQRSFSRRNRWGYRETNSEPA